MCVQLQDGVVSVSCTGGAIRTEGCELRAESTGLSCAALVCVRACVRSNISVPVLGQVIADVRKDHIAFILNGEGYLRGSGLLK
jgi:hypothetical protein